MLESYNEIEQLKARIIKKNLKLTEDLKNYKNDIKNTVISDYNI